MDLIDKVAIPSLFVANLAAVAAGFAYTTTTTALGASANAINNSKANNPEGYVAKVATKTIAESWEAGIDSSFQMTDHLSSSMSKTEPEVVVEEEVKPKKRRATKAK